MKQCALKYYELCKNKGVTKYDDVNDNDDDHHNIVDPMYITLLSLINKFLTGKELIGDENIYQEMLLEIAKDVNSFLEQNNMDMKIRDDKFESVSLHEAQEGNVSKRIVPEIKIIDVVNEQTNQISNGIISDVKEILTGPVSNEISEIKGELINQVPNGIIEQKVISNSTTPEKKVISYDTDEDLKKKMEYGKIVLDKIMIAELLKIKQSRWTISVI